MKDKFKIKITKQTTMFLVLLVSVFALFSFLIPNGSFYLPRNLNNMVTDMVIPAIFALGMGIIFSAGGFDLSLGHIASICALVVAYLMSPTFMYLPGFAIFIGILLAIALGGISGLIVSRLGVSSFIVTLGMQFLIIGLRQIVTGGQMIYISHAGFKSIASSPLGFSNMIIVLIIVAVACYIFMERTTVGRKIQFIGANIEASRYMGINVKMLTMLTFILGAVMACIGGVLFSARAGAVQLNSADAMLLDAITIAVLSKVMFNNKYKTFGIIAVAFLISMITTGMSMSGIPSEWVEFVKGLIIVISIIMSKI